jgi:hypothetical protein
LAEPAEPAVRAVLAAVAASAAPVAWGSKVAWDARPAPAVPAELGAPEASARQANRAQPVERLEPV